jgi:hypothetical protein
MVAPGDVIYAMAYYSAYMMYSRHSSLAQLFVDDSDGFRSGLDDDGSDMEIYGGVKGVLSCGFSGWKGLIFVILGAKGLNRNSPLYFIF